MARSVKELRSIVCTSRLKYDADDEYIEEKNNITLSSTDSGLGSEVKDSKKLNSKTETPKHLLKSKFSKSTVTTSNTINNTNKKTLSSHSKPISLPLNTDLESFLIYLDMVVVAGWLDASKKKIDVMKKIMNKDEFFCQFCHYWLSVLNEKSRFKLLKSLIDSLIKEMKSAFLSSPNQINSQIILNSVLHEFKHFEKPYETYNNGQISTNNHTTEILSDFITLTSLQGHNQSREILSDVKYHSAVKPHQQGVLAMRAHGLVSVWSGVVECFKKQQKAKHSSFGFRVSKKKGNNKKKEVDCSGVEKITDLTCEDVKDGDLKDSEIKIDKVQRFNKNDDDEDDNEDDDDDDDDDDEGKVRMRNENEEKMDRLMCVISNNHISVLKYLIESDKVTLKYSDSCHRSLLMHAVVLDRPCVLQWLVDEAEKKGREFVGCLLNQTSESGNTALHMCVNTHNQACLKILLSSAFTNVNQCNIFSSNATPLHLAIMHNETEMVEMLLEAGADVDEGDVTMTQVISTFNASPHIIKLLHKQ